MTDWISVKDKLPGEDTAHLLLVTDWGGIFIGWWGEYSIPPSHKRYKYRFVITEVDDWQHLTHLGGRRIKITHWMPLPEPPTP